MYRPLKAIYIKSNPGDAGTGIIEDITYKNIEIKQTIWWTIWIGPQQQNQPGKNSTNTGCNFLYPFVPVCPTNPLVTIRNIQLENIAAVDTIPLLESPGVIICNSENPCENINFINVTNSKYEGDWESIIPYLPVPVPDKIFPTKYRPENPWEYITDQATGIVKDSVPSPW